MTQPRRQFYRRKRWLAAGLLWLAGCDRAIDAVKDSRGVRDARETARDAADDLRDPAERKRAIEAVKRIPDAAEDISEGRAPPLFGK